MFNHYVQQKEVSVIPAVVRALGTLTANLKKNLKELGIPNVIPYPFNSVELLITSPMHRRQVPVDAGTFPSLTTI